MPCDGTGDAGVQVGEGAQAAPLGEAVAEGGRRLVEPLGREATPVTDG